MIHLWMHLHADAAGEHRHILADTADRLRRCGLFSRPDVVPHVWPSDETAPGECSTLGKLRDWAAGHPGQTVLYAHTKGASRPNNRNVWLWRQYLEYACFDQAETMLAALADGYAAAGTELVGPGTPGYPDRHGWQPDRWAFLGNHWWTTSDHINRLAPRYDCRHDAEWRFITTAPGRYFSLHYSARNLYETPFSRWEYEGLYHSYSVQLSS